MGKKVKRHEEHQYLDLVREVIETGDLRKDRTGVGKSVETPWNIMGKRNEMKLIGVG
jgi:thymidylate synthase